MKTLNLTLRPFPFDTQKLYVIHQLIQWNVARKIVFMGIIKLDVFMYRVSQKNDPTLHCHIFKDNDFDVFKFSTVIQHGLK